VLRLTEPGAAAGEPTGRLARAWATAVNGLGVMAAAVLVGLVWLTPLVVLVGLVLLGLRALRRPAPTWAQPPRPRLAPRAWARRHRRCPVCGKLGAIGSNRSSVTTGMPMLAGPSPTRPTSPQGIASRVVAPQRILGCRPRGGIPCGDIAGGDGRDQRAAGGVVRLSGVGSGRPAGPQPRPAGRAPGRAAAPGSRHAAPLAAPGNPRPSRRRVPRRLTAAPRRTTVAPAWSWPCSGARCARSRSRAAGRPWTSTRRDPRAGPCCPRARGEPTPSQPGRIGPGGAGPSTSRAPPSGSRPGPSSDRSCPARRTRTASRVAGRPAPTARAGSRNGISRVGNGTAVTTTRPGGTGTGAAGRGTGGTGTRAGAGPASPGDRIPPRTGP
jgi:hypothetical protein